MVVKAWSGQGGFWLGEPHVLDGEPITTMEELAAYLADNGFVLLYAWGPGETEKSSTPTMLNASYIEAWEECGFDEVIGNLPEKSRIQKDKARLAKQRRHT